MRIGICVLLTLSLHAQTLMRVQRRAPSGGGGPTPAILHTWGGSNSGSTTTTVSMGGTSPTGGGTMFMLFAGGNFTSVTTNVPSDDKGGTWVEDASYANGGPAAATGYLKVYRRTTPTTTDITSVTLATAWDLADAIVFEASNLAASPLDPITTGKQNGYDASTWDTNATGASLTALNDLMIGFAFDFRGANTFSHGTGWTDGAAQGRAYFEWKLATSTASGQTADGAVVTTSNNQVISILVTYKQ